MVLLSKFTPFHSQPLRNLLQLTRGLSSIRKETFVPSKSCLGFGLCTLAPSFSTTSISTFSLGILPCNKRFLLGNTSTWNYGHHSHNKYYYGTTTNTDIPGGLVNSVPKPQPYQNVKVIQQPILDIATWVVFNQNELTRNTMRTNIPLIRTFFTSALVSAAKEPHPLAKSKPNNKPLNENPGNAQNANLNANTKQTATTASSSTIKIEAKASGDANNTGANTKAVVSKKLRLKQAVKDYGATVIVFHVAISLVSLGLFYLLVSSGLDVVGLLGKLGVGEKILQSKITHGASTFVVAYAVHKVFAPVRITITLSATPLIVRKLRTMGVLKKSIQK